MPSTVVRPCLLTAPQRRVFDEALRLGTDLADEVESKVAAYGRWLLESVFDNDSTAALDGSSKNPVWLELVRRAGGPTLRISRRMLYVSLQLAARDKRITDQSWRGLDSGRKELLLPLEDDRKMREAARHVSKFNLTQSKTREYVGELIAEEGGERQVRLSAPAIVSRVKKLRESLGSAAALRKVKAISGTLPAAKRHEVMAEIEKLRHVLDALTKELRS